MFQAVHNKRFPGEAKQLLAYGHFIPTMIEDGAKWQGYDEAFRRQREIQTTKYRWDQFHTVLYNWAYKIDPVHKFSVGSNEPKFTKPTQSFRSSSNEKYDGVPPGFCYDFHNKTSSSLQFDIVSLLSIYQRTHGSISHICACLL